MSRLPVLILIALFSTAVQAQNAALASVATASTGAACDADVEALEALIRTEYAGRDLLLEDDRDVRFVEALEAARPLMGADCDRGLHAATALFPDGHLEVASATPSTGVRGGVRRFSPWSGETGVRFVGDNAAVIRIRSFAGDAKPAIDSMMAAHAERLASTPVWVVDVTMNGGGADRSFDALLPYLATGTVRQANAEVVAAPGNRAHMVALAGEDWVDDETRAYLLGLADRMEAEEGAFVPLFEMDEIVTEADSVLPFPRAVAVLTDAGTASSAEEFVLIARQSAKVVVVGGSTYGALDYSNVRRVALPSGVRTLHLPMTRRGWLPKTSVDAAGIAPDVWVPEGVADWTSFALGVLEARVR